MQAQKSVQLMSVRVIVLAFALLTALLLASAAGYVIRGGTTSAAPTLIAPLPSHPNENAPVKADPYSSRQGK